MMEMRTTPFAIAFVLCLSCTPVLSIPCVQVVVNPRPSFTPCIAMVRFLRYWIQSSMEDPQVREENARKHLELVRCPSLNFLESHSAHSEKGRI